VTCSKYSIRFYGITTMKPLVLLIYANKKEEEGIVIGKEQGE
jgi:hypothetical protein